VLPTQSVCLSVPIIVPGDDHETNLSDRDGGANASNDRSTPDLLRAGKKEKYEIPG
jgi:hypothetical protein